MDRAAFIAAIADIEASATAIFPAMFERPDVFWPDDDWRAFLEVAGKAAAQVIYVHTERTGSDILGEALAVVETLSGETQNALAHAQAWGGPTDPYRVGVRCRGVRHV